MDYTIQPTGTTPAFIIKPYTANGPGNAAANTTLQLFGKGDGEYGEPMANNLVHMLEHFAGPSQPASIIQGQLWYNNGTSTLSLYDGVALQTIVLNNGLMSADLKLNGHKIINLGTPTVATDAATKAYVDLAAGSGTANDLATTGAPVDVALAAPPSTNDILAATDATHATWQTIAGVLGYTPYDATNPAGYITGITSNDVATAQGLVQGSIFLGTGPNTGSALAIGANTYILTSNGTTAVWQAPAAGSFTANDLATTGAPVDVAAAAPPSTGKILAATDATHATWQTIAGVLGYTPYNILTPTVTSGSIGATTGIITLTLPYGSPGTDVIIPNVSPAIHDHIPSEIIIDANPTGYDLSRMRDISINSVASFPRISMEDMLAYFDQDLFKLMDRKRRTVFTVIAAQTITGVTTGALGTWTIAGNYVKEFLAGATVTIAGNGGAGVDGAYTVDSSTYFGGNTIITVTTIPGTATISGTIVPTTYALDLDSEYVVQHNDLVVYGNGVKLYAAERGNAYVLFPGITAGDWCGLVNGSYNFTLAVDGGGGSLKTITVARPSYTIAGVTNVPGGTWTISGGDFTSQFVQYETIVITGNTGLGVNTVYTVASVVYSAPNTIVTVNETITGATGDGSMEKALLFTQLEPLVNAQISSAGAFFDSDVSYYSIYSNTPGTGSQIVYTSGTLDTTMATNLAVTATIVNRPAVASDLGYKEIGIPYNYSNTIQLDPSITVGTVVECTCTVG